MLAALRRAARYVRHIPRRVGYGRCGPMLMSDLRRLWVLARNPHADIRFEGRSYLGPGFSLHMPYGGTFSVGPGVEFRRNFRAEIGPGGSVVVGAGSFLTYDVIIACSTSIEIGERVGIGQAAFVVDGSHKYRDTSKPFLEQGYNFRPLKIADDVAIHSKCTIIADVGERAVIGANSIVTKPIPAFSVAAGVPAKVIDYFGPEGSEPPGVAARSRDAEG